jgi:hypothetical protein
VEGRGNLATYIDIDGLPIRILNRRIVAFNPNILDELSWRGPSATAGGMSTRAGYTNLSDSFCPHHLTHKWYVSTTAATDDAIGLSEHTCTQHHNIDLSAGHPRVSMRSTTERVGTYLSGLCMADAEKSSMDWRTTWQQHPPGREKGWGRGRKF